MDYEMNPEVQKYLAEKLAERQAVQKEYEDQTSNLGMGQFAAGLGAALAGRSPDQVNQQFEGIRNRIKGETLGAYDAAQKAKAIIDEYQQKNDCDTVSAWVVKNK